MKFGVITFPGSNCEQDCIRAAEEGLGEEAVPLWHRSADLQGADVVILPGGFAHGDYLRPGAIARFSPIMETVCRFAAEGGTVLGICNGFQILCEAGLLPGAFLPNRTLQYICRQVYVRVERRDTRFTNACPGDRPLRIPIGHGVGNYFADPPTMERLEDQGQVVLRYAGPSGEVTDAVNPNGSQRNVAGIMNETGNVMGLMPHPDRAYDARLGSADGLYMWKSIRNAAEDGTTG